MAFEMEMPESTDTGGAYLEKPGTYHLAVVNVDENPIDKQGSLLSGFKIEASVLGGTTEGQQNRTVELMFWNPKPTDKNNGEMAKKKQARFVMAVGLLDGARKPGEKVTIDLQQAKGRQLVATLDHRDDKKDSSKKYLDLHFADIWHVDDPEVKDVPKHLDALKLLPASLRRTNVKPTPASQTNNKQQTQTPALDVNSLDL